LYSGIELLCYPILAIGGAGFISATANVDPKRVAALYNARDEGDIHKAQDLHFELMPLNDVLFTDTNPAPAKAALGMMGKITQQIRPPISLPSTELQTEIRATLVGLHLISQELVHK